MKSYRLGSIRKSFPSSESQWVVVLDNGAEIGLVTKFRDTATEQHPWKCFIGIGEKCQFIGVTWQGKDMAAWVVVGEHRKRLEALAAAVRESDEARTCLGLSARDLDRMMPSERY